MENESDYSEFVRRLIDAVRDRRCIYDKKHVSYFNKFERERAWCEIAEVLGQSVDDCQKRWKLLREKLAKELKKRDRALACGEHFESDWTCFEKIIFIADHIAPRKKVEKIPFFCTPLLHPPSDSNHSNGSVSFRFAPDQKQQQCASQEQLQQQDYNMVSYQQLHCKTPYSLRLAYRRRSASERSAIDNLDGRNNHTDDDDYNNLPEKVEEEAGMDPKSREVKEESQPSDEHNMIDIDDLSNDDRYIDPPNEWRPATRTTREHSRKPATTLKRLKVREFNVEPRKFARMMETDSDATMFEDGDTLFGKMVTVMLKDIVVEECKDDVKLAIMQALIQAKRAKI